MNASASLLNPQSAAQQSAAPERGQKVTYSARRSCASAAELCNRIRNLPPMETHMTSADWWARVVQAARRPRICCQCMWTLHKAGHHAAIGVKGCRRRPARSCSRWMESYATRGCSGHTSRPNWSAPLRTRGPTFGRHAGVTGAARGARVREREGISGHGCLLLRAGKLYSRR
jgi:hypothetical protein